MANEPTHQTAPREIASDDIGGLPMEGDGPIECQIASNDDALKIAREECRQCRSARVWIIMVHSALENHVLELHRTLQRSAIGHADCAAGKQGVAIRQPHASARKLSNIPSLRDE